MRMKRRAREAGLLAALLVIAALVYTLFATPALYVGGDNSYIGSLRTLGLSDPSETAYQGEVVERYTYERYDMFSLLSLSSPSKAYPAALVRLFTQPFGMDFDTRYLAMVYMAVIALGTYWMVSGLYKYSRLAAVSVSGLLPVLCTYAPVICYLNSLYDMGATVAFSILFMGSVTSCLCRNRGDGFRIVAPVPFCGLLLLRAQGNMIALAPAVLAICVLCFVYACPQTKGKWAHLLCCGLVLLYCGQGAVAGLLADVDITSDAANYLAVFQGYLTASEDVKADVEALDLPADCAEDVGRSYYDPEESFARNPRDEEESESLLTKITLSKRLAFCLRHPNRVPQIVRNAYQHFYDAYNDRMVTSDGQTRFVRPSPLVLLNLPLSVQGTERMTMFMLMGALFCLSCLLVAPRGTGVGRLCVCQALLLAGFALYLPTGMFLTGGVDVYTAKVPVFFFAWMSIFAAITAGLCLGSRVMNWLAEGGVPLRCVGVQEPEAAIRLDRLTNRINRRSLLVFCAVVCVAIGVWTLGPDVHIGGVNNGDYGRMMEQLDITWTEDMMYDYGAQATTKVVEDYDYLSNVRLEQLTSADPTYSLIYPSLLVRLWSAITGRPFSTRVLAALLLVITILCILLIVRDLYAWLGKWTVLPAVALICMLLGENYIAWYNALFGESMLSVGLIMTLTCAIHLIAMERGKKQSWLWLVLMGFSVRLMACSKAQMALSMPGGVMLLVSLALYHHPLKKMKKRQLAAFAVVIALLVGIIGYDTLMIYRKNGDVNEKYTVWQSVFYGLLMISDDPDETMADLDIDPAMKPDIGKHAYLADEEYVYPVASQEAEDGFWGHVNTISVVMYYLRHPVYLIRMLNRAAQESIHLHTGFMAYTDEIYTEHTTLCGFTLWQHLRPLFACHKFWQYVLLYGAAAIFCLRKICSKTTTERGKLLALLFLCIMAMGALQYPLSVLGNGFADNNKQLYGFMLCHDLLVVFAATAAAKWIGSRKSMKGRSAS